ncbi:MAG: prenyltransferase/squalene oxidase repeat-containing protein [Pirellulales bacterium]
MNLEVDLERLSIAHKAVRAELLAEFSGGCWTGSVSSSPVATAAAVAALVVSHRQCSNIVLPESSADDSQVIEQIVQCDLSELLLEAVHWLAKRQNTDGGWGDCEGAGSDVSATMLVQAAFRLTGIPAKYADLMVRADQFVAAQGGVAGLKREVGPDKSYLASILTACALADMIPWRQVPSLPFEWCSVPSRLQHEIGLMARWGTPLVMAVGLAKFHNDPPRNPLIRFARRRLRKKTLAYLEQLQAADDSFQGSPLSTAFIVMSLASTGCQEHPIVERGVEYLLSSVRADSSWSVAMNFATTNTARAYESLTAGMVEAPYVWHEQQESMAIGSSWPDPATARDTLPDHLPAQAAVAENGLPPESFGDDSSAVREQAIDWLLRTQRTTPCATTSAPAGGWGVSDAPGAEPTTISTACALVALARAWHADAAAHRGRIERAANLGINWLLEMQNDDGGWPTYCKDDNTHPFDGSATDPTAQAMRALAAWQRLWHAQSQRDLPGPRAKMLGWMVAAIEQGLQYLESQQRDDGSFVPMWFGDELQTEDENPVLGTALVLAACGELHCCDSNMAQRAAAWMVASQHSGGGWGPPRAPVDYSEGDRAANMRSWRENDTLAKFCSVEETAAAVSALVPFAAMSPALERSVSRGLAWLASAAEEDRLRRPAIVGFYLSQIWYYERLYPLVFAAGALSRALAATSVAVREPATTS